ncbi:glucan endo-1,3-beta-glucosidase 8-like [Chenopodium quinoa]|uniref:glucan endo-1,3-beta-glucosidase 8-like n=1 Tax=Chenopodium quinoa TaxID=63459 RepID=UPI000B789EFF|nr:glucan endo-1,3-beta-glucosidase 8-like [Chenopodium quinoa]
MARAMVLWLWTFIMLVAMVNGADQKDNIGVNWGNIASHPLPPSNVVGMLKDNGLNKVKLFDADSSTLNALAGTGIEVMVAIPNDMLRRLNKYKHAKEWVKKNVTKHLYDGGVNIRYVAVGNEPLLASYNDSFKQTTFPALQNIMKALEESGHGDIKASVPLNADVYESSSTMPSSGDFRGDVKDLMLDIVGFLKEKGAPFIVNIYPFLSLYQNPNFPEDFAFFDGGAKTINDNSHTYSNVFDANFDTLVWALKKNGYGDLKIVVGEIGWPTDGHIKANTKFAKKFYDGLLKKLASNKGTPMRPGPMEAYLFGLLDENMKSIDPGDFERHWGIFRYDGQPKFPMDLNGKGNDKMPIGAKGVQYMESKWCIFNTDAKNQDKIVGSVEYACSRSDCTSLGYGSSCNDLDANGNISYAFNMYFQLNDQSVEACQFDGLATITSTNASQQGCLFPIEVVSAAIRISMIPTKAVILVFTLVLFLLL